MVPAQLVLIEDNPADVLLIKLALQENGIIYNTLEFNSGMEAVQALCSGNGPKASELDAFLLDLHTPGSDGFEVVGKLLQHFQGVPIAILTSSRAHADRRRATQLGVRYVEKPSELKMFLEVVGGTVQEMLAARKTSKIAHGIE